MLKFLGKAGNAWVPIQSSMKIILPFFVVCVKECLSFIGKISAIDNDTFVFSLIGYNNFGAVNVLYICQGHGSYSMTRVIVRIGRSRVLPRV